MTRSILLTLLLTACGSGSSSAPDEPPPADPATTGEEPAGSGRRTMTDAECTAAGGTLVGDIGDGATHRPDYVCANGQPPLGDVALGIEGSVCCGP